MTIAPTCLLVSFIQQLLCVEILTAKCGAVKEEGFWKVVMLYVELCPREWDQSLHKTLRLPLGHYCYESTQKVLTVEQPLLFTKYRLFNVPGQNKYDNDNPWTKRIPVQSVPKCVLTYWIKMRSIASMALFSLWQLLYLYQIATLGTWTLFRNQYH